MQTLTGITVGETVPDWVLDRANEIVLADLTPEALATRMARRMWMSTSSRSRADAPERGRGPMQILVVDPCCQPCGEQPVWISLSTFAC